jgi:hypothetical protein
MFVENSSVAAVVVRGHRHHIDRLGKGCRVLQRPENSPQFAESDRESGFSFIIVSERGSG